MKCKFTVFIPFVLLFATVLSSCNDYLDVVPKGRKIPKTLADFEALMRDEYTNQRFPIAQATLLLNDYYERQENLNYSQLSRINYMWEEGTSRINFNNTSEGTYYTGYAAISTFNLLVQYVPTATEATEQQRKTLVAQAKLARAMHYFVLVNYYADTYEAANAGSKLSVPLIESADISAPHKQVTIQEMYDYILLNITEALPDLPADGATVVHATVAAAHAFRARVYLQMGNYPEALQAADMALAENDQLFDWTAYYESYKDLIEQPGLYPSLPSPKGYDYVENYIFGHGEVAFASSENDVRVDRAGRFEPGDASFAARWKLRTLGNETYYQSITAGRYNQGGITTAEVYLIKAECLARNNDLTGAMQALNAVRAKRILPQSYTALSAANTRDAINLIRRTKENEMLFTIVAFADMRRFNKDPQYARTLTKKADNVTLSLKPESHLWTMPFPLGAINNPGNGTIKQNVNQ
ncbi:RagB/SusD family nutrient uptake outer membrane protein [Chitinophaga horti]|uniref:RagB/SusD family nutrient uptake outer membrane protein n=1 Tax=Chitinophaga horti TaxID=2920382 RepID=A0ABY6J7T6_9BACT|nr:RagB/SusD family nutrient uptake outer membrane protein [Chitinophaga horti]UYQ95745.1 RagB/SusD family nutrient uptake outer membrane protein [Chitinophaga horti]